jgi:hypothetical protein
MNEVRIKSVNRKTTISKAAIKRAVKIAFAESEKNAAIKTASKKVRKAA